MWLYNSFHIGPEHFFLFFVEGEPSTESLLLRVGFLQLQEVGATLRCGVHASHCGGFSYWGARALERSLSTCGAPRIWDFPGPGLEPMSPTLASGFRTTREVPGPVHF